MRFYFTFCLLFAITIVFSKTQISDSKILFSPCDYVNPLIGTGGEGRICPVACVPFGMIQLGADTRTINTGYHYNDSIILGFSHTHKSGAGCGDFLDIRFMPFEGKGLKKNGRFNDKEIISKFYHSKEHVEPGYYSVFLEKHKIKVELSTSLHCGIQRYSFLNNSNPALLVDLKYGSTCACTILKESDRDTVRNSQIEIVDKYTIRGFRISDGFASDQRIYFYLTFSTPITSIDIYENDLLTENIKQATGRNIKAIINFDTNKSKIIIAKTGISEVDLEGARLNYETEIKNKSFEVVKLNSRELWQNELSKIQVEAQNEKQREIFYTSLYYTLMYPTTYSDVDGRFRGPDHQIHNADNFTYYGGVMGIWDTFRAASPLLALLRPDVANDYIKTFLAHYKIFGQLPIWVLAGVETFQMIGLPSMPIIADYYYKGIRNYDVDAVFEAMKTSAMKDTCGFSMGYFVGLKNYKKLGYVPADLEMESVARTLEYAYSDWCISQMAKMLNKTDDYIYFENRSKSYRHVFDKNVSMMRGRLSDGKWRDPFDPLASNHRRDDYCEGNAWQWTFFVPHDVEGLAKLMGGDEKLILKLDSLFTLNSTINGENTSGDISGLIGQYAHGNEPSHHIAYMYSYLGQPWKTQKYTHQIMTTLYNNTPDGYCGQEDTGQMSAWFVLSSLGFYPVTHGNGELVIGTPLMKNVIFKHNSGQLKIIANGLSEKNIYIQSIKLNHKPYLKSYFLHYDLFKGDALVEFEMGKMPNLSFGKELINRPSSMKF